MLLGLSLALLILGYYRSAVNPTVVPILAFLSLRWLDRPIRFVLFGGIGLALIVIGIWGANRSLLKPFERSGRPLIDTIQSFRRREKGMRVVVIGGGHGLATLLRGLKEYTHNITAIVTVADNGGSSGELKRDMGILPPATSATAWPPSAVMKRCFPRCFNTAFKPAPVLPVIRSATC